MFKIITVFAAFLFVSSALIVSCGNSAANGQRNWKIEPEPSASPGISCQSDDVCINAEGWRLPSLEGAKASAASKETLKDSSGKNIEVETVNYVLENTSTEEPFNLIGKNFGKLKLSFVRQFSKNEKVFAYVIFAQRTKRDDATQSDEGTGTIFFFTFVDRDGDGKFETLVRGQKPELTVPDWTLRNTD
ncbi:MAG: hypothetical protein IT173_07575 [Acidobacteria bacterium]|nr:hypothetical protein [Acidobacteriota bacterium]